MEKTVSLPNESFIEILQTVLKKGSSFRFTATGFSMLPFIRDGDVLTISPAENHIIASGAVVACVHPVSGTLVIHRVLGRKRNCYLIKGDAVSGADGFVARDSIFGVVTRMERKGTHIVLGAGPERCLIAVLSRYNFFYAAVSVLKYARRINRAIRNLIQ